MSGKKSYDEDALLENAIKKHEVPDRKPLFMILGVALALLPTYLFTAVHNMELTNVLNLLVVLPVVGACAHSFSVTYHKSFEARWWVQQGQISERNPAKKGGKVDREQEGFQAAMGYALWFNNGIFLLAVLFLQFSMLKAFDARLNYILSMVIPTAVLYWLAGQNEKVVKNKKGGKRH